MKQLLVIVILAVAVGVALRLDRNRRRVERIVIVTIDTARADHVSILGYPRGTTHALRRLAEEGFLFERAYAASPDLSLSLRTISTSRHPVEAVSPAALGLLERLRARGFDTAAFTDDASVLPDLDANAGESGAGLGETVECAIRWMTDSDRGRRAALWLHLNGSQEARAPSTLDETSPIGPQLRRYLETRQDLPRSSTTLEKVRFHDARLYAVDRAINRFYWSTLDRKKPTMIVVTGCRGEALEASDDGLRLDEGMIRVPLIVWFSDDRGPGKILPGMARHVDIWPTIADFTLSARQRWAMRAEGRSFAPALRLQGGWSNTVPAYFKRSSGSAALVAGHRKLIRDRAQWRRFDLKTDPFEKIDLGEVSSDEWSLMRRRLERFARGGG